MKYGLVYDWPTRLFHWLFAGLFLTSFIIAKTIEDDNFWFNFHSIAGLIIGFLVLLRLVWGVMGTRHALFTGFALKPIQLISYFKALVTGQKKRWAGHNPASSWAALVMMVFALGLAITGYLMTSGPNKEDFEDIHELMANGFIIVVILHVVGLILHTLKYKEMIALSMLNGKKSDIPNGESIKSSRPVFGILLLVFTVVFGAYLVTNYERSSQTLNFFGTTLQLGEGQPSED